MKHIYIVLLLLLTVCKTKVPVVSIDLPSHLVVYEMKLSEPENYKAILTYINKEGKKDTLTLRKDWRYEFEAKEGSPLLLGVVVKSVNPIAWKRGLAELNIWLNGQTLDSGKGYKMELTNEAKPISRDPNRLRTY